ncbi:hypothetical protein [Streptomyces sp. NPDC005732]|uniref:hypothetical protein n=1 Tax=Streptomyces sp. NPDC005732 TaxID=3157057 RepID=UPI00340E612B
MASIDFPDDLIALARTSWAEIQAGTLTVATAQAVHEGVAAFAAEAGHPRLDVEMGLKRAVRHPVAEAA